MANLPAYITSKQRDPNALSLAQRGLQNVGSGAGPYVSIEGNRFALVDAAGNHQPIQTLYIDLCIVDLNDHLSKMYYDQPWDPNNPAPPACFSDNGLAPSTQASSPQSLTCAGCPKNVWGSKVSAQGSEIKACRDEQKTAAIVPGMPNNIFRLTIPPNSLKPWRGYLAKFGSAGFDIQDVVTRVTFQAGVNGTLEFNPAPSPWLDDATLAVRDKALAAKASDIIVGRLDRPRQGVMPALGLAAPLAPAGNVVEPAATHSAVDPAWPSGTPTQQATPTQPSSMPATTASPSDPPQRRRRRTQAEMAAQNGQAPAPQQAQPQMAPFRPEASPASGGQAPGPAFGVGAGVAPNPELQAAINNIFGT